MFGVLASLVGSQLFKGVKDAGKRKLLQSGLDSVGSTVGSYFSSEFKRRQEMKLYDAKRQRELENWRMQNEYNLPKEQIRRLREAGLNPALIYSQGASGNTAGSIGSPGYGGDGLDVFANIQQKRKNDAEIRNIDAGTEKSIADAEKARAEAASLRGETEPVKADMAYKEAMTNLAESQNIGEGFKNEMLEFQRDIQQDVWTLDQEERRSRINENNERAKHFTQSASYQALKVANFPDELANLRASTEAMWNEAHVKEWQAYYAQEYYEALKDSARSNADSRRLLYEYENATQEQRVQMMKNSFDMQEVQRAIIEKTKDARIKLEEAMADSANVQSWFTFFKEYQALHESFARSIYALAKSYAVYKTGGKSEMLPDNSFTFEFGAPTDFD